MIETQLVEVRNTSGLHARPAGLVVKAAAACTGKVTIIKGDKRVNAKSLISLLTAGIQKGDNITVEVEDGQAGELERVIEVIRNLKD